MTTKRGWCRLALSRKVSKKIEMGVHAVDVNVIAKNLVRLRAGRRRELVAAALEISVSSLAMYETGKRVPRDEVKLALAKYYGASVESIFFSHDVTKRDAV